MFNHSAIQYEVMFRLGDKEDYWSGDDGRDLIGRLLRDQPEAGLDPIFHHRSDGSLGEGLAPFRFRGGRGNFAIIALNDESADFLMSKEYIIRRALSYHYGHPVPIHTSHREVAIALSPYMKFYRASRLVFARKHQHLKTRFAWSAERQMTCIQELLLRDIQKQADASGLDMPSGPLPLQVFGIGPLTTIPLNKAGQKLYVGATHHADFMSTLDLKGSWNVGGLTNRGYGYITQSQRPTATESIQITDVGAHHAVV